MDQKIQPLRAKAFLKAVAEYMEPLKGTYIHQAVMRDYREKTDHVDVGYGNWLQRLLSFLTDRYHLQGKRVLDLGCGTGELTVRMRSLGYEVLGLDVHPEHIDLARILARENDLNGDIFILNSTKKLPFADGSFDLVTMFSIVEHLNDFTLAWLLPEVRRVTRGVVYIIVPNRLKPTDDHTGLHFVPWMPRWLALRYVQMRGWKHRYHISKDRSWDVYFRTFGRIVSLFCRYGFDFDLPPDDMIYPSLEQVSALTRIGKRVRLGRRILFIGVPLPVKVIRRFGYPLQALYPYLNLVFLPRRVA